MSLQDAVIAIDQLNGLLASIPADVVNTRQQAYDLLSQIRANVVQGETDLGNAIAQISATQAEASMAAQGAAQAAQARGGVGAAQTQQQVEAYRQQLLAQQYDYGLKLSGIGDNIALGAIKTGLEADRYVQQLNNSFYTNMAYVASGMSPGIRLGGNQ